MTTFFTTFCALSEAKGMDIIIMNKPLVTLLLVTYKKFDNIFAVLDSVFQQDYDELELIIQDDGSPNYEECIQDVKMYIKSRKTPNVKRVCYNHLQENLGTCKNTNAGIVLAQGKYLKLLTADDALYNNSVISKCVEVMEQTDTRVLVGQTFIMRRDSGVIDEIEENVWYRWSARSGRKCNIIPSTRDIEYMSKLDKSKRLSILKSRCIISTVSVFYRTELLEETKGFIEDYRLVEDMTYWPFLAGREEDFLFRPIIMMKYELSGISNGGNLKSEFNKECKDIMDRIYIPNEVAGGIFNKYYKGLRYKEMEYMYLDGVSRKSFKYLDVLIYRFVKSVRYLLLGTRL